MRNREQSDVNRLDAVCTEHRRQLRTNPIVGSFPFRISSSGKEPFREVERMTAGGGRAEQITGSIVRFDGYDATVLTGDASALRDRRVSTHDVLQHSDAKERVENAVSKRQMGGVRGGEFDPLVVRSGFLERRNDFGQHPVDAMQLDLGNMQSPETDLGQAGATTDVQDSVSRSRPKRLRQKLGEVVVPPSLTQILQRGGLEAINRRNHV